MDRLEQLATAKTPYICFEATTGILQIEGRSIPEAAEDFWAPFLKWVYAYCSQPCAETKLICNLEYFNNTSTKQILFILHKLDELFEKGNKVLVEWNYSKEDDEMKEVGFDLSCMVNFPFTFRPNSCLINIEK